MRGYDLKNVCLWFSRYVIAAMLVDGKRKIARFVCPPAFVHFTIVICVSRDCMKTTYCLSSGPSISKFTLEA